MSPFKYFLQSSLVICALILSACTNPSSPSRPVVTYPVTYIVQVGNTQVNANTGPQNLTVSATQDVAVDVGRTFYYQIVSPMDVMVDVYEVSPGSTRTVVNQVRGTSLTASVTPRTSALRFVFSAAQPNTGGSLKFTLSDRPITSSISSIH